MREEGRRPSCDLLQPENETTRLPRWCRRMRFVETSAPSHTSSWWWRPKNASAAELTASGERSSILGPKFWLGEERFSQSLGVAEPRPVNCKELHSNDPMAMEKSRRHGLFDKQEVIGRIGGILETKWGG